MTQLAPRRHTPRPRWPMTRDAWHSLVDELARLRADVASLAGELTDGVSDIAVARAARRLDVLSRVLEGGEQVHDLDRAIIGRRITIREADGDASTYAIVFPGDGEPAEGWLSADSPLGAAVLGRSPGDAVEVTAPAGSRVVTVLAVE